MWQEPRLSWTEQKKVQPELEKLSKKPQKPLDSCWLRNVKTEAKREKKIFTETVDDEELSKEAPEGREREEKETSESEENTIKTVSEEDISKKNEEGVNYRREKRQLQLH